MLTLLATLALVVLLVVDWRTRSRWVRAAAVLVALGVFALAQDCLYCAVRAALDLASSGTDTLGASGVRPSTEYERGVRTLHRLALANREVGATARTVSLAALAWLALTPALRRAIHPTRERAGAAPDDAVRLVGAGDPPATAAS